MPKEIKKIDIKVDPRALVKSSKLAAHIAIISSQWCEIEEELAFLFIFGMQTEPAVAAAVLGSVFSVAVKLDMIKTALSLRFPDKAVEPFDNIRGKVMKRSRERNRFVHGVWTIHKDHPNSLIRLAGITDPKLEIQKYVRRDFVETEMRLLRLLISLKQFSQSLLPYLNQGEKEQAERFWHLPGPPPDGNAAARLHIRPESLRSARSTKPRPKRTD